MVYVLRINIYIYICSPNPIRMTKKYHVRRRPSLRLYTSRDRIDSRRSSIFVIFFFTFFFFFIANKHNIFVLSTRRPTRAHLVRRRRRHEYKPNADGIARGRGTTLLSWHISLCFVRPTKLTILFTPGKRYTRVALTQRRLGTIL